MKRRHKRLAAMLPAAGVAIGPEAIREAVQRSFSEVEQILDAKLREIFKVAGDDDPWVWVTALYGDTFVAKRDGKFYRYPYSVTDSDVTIGSPTEVVQSWAPVGGVTEAQGDLPGGDLPGPLVKVVEAAGGKDGLAFEIRVIRAGLSGNGNYYPDAVLREAVSLFENVRVLVKSDDEHLAGKGKSVRNLLGRLTEARFVEGAGADQGEIRARLDVISAESAEATMMREAVERGLGGLFGFSIDASCQVARARRGGTMVREAKKFLKVSSVDLIVEPGAGGEVIQLVEAQSPAEEEDAMWRTRLIEALKKRGLLKAGEAESLTDEELETRMTEALGGEPEPGRGDPPALDPKKIAAEAAAAVRLEVSMREAVNGSQLPAKMKDRLVKRVEAGEFADVDTVREAVREELDLVTELTRGGRPSGLGSGGADITFGETRPEKVGQMLEAFFDPSHKHHRQAQSFREIYVEITGDKRVTGQLQHCDRQRLREALAIGDFREAYDSTTLSNVLGDSIARRMQAMYRNQSVYDVYQRICTTVPIQDFRTQERTQIGGYGDIPVVGEGAPYLAFETPDDDKATYRIEKRGGTESVTLEMIRNDDVGVIRRIPTKLSGAAKRTLAKFVLDFIRLNPVIYDDVNLFHNDHANLGTTALASGSLAAARLRMKSHTEPGSGEKLSIPARSLLVPDTLEETAVDLFRRTTENDKTFVQSLTLDILPVWYWSDPTDWALAADPNDIPMIELGFLDGQEEPELFVQDSPTAGSMFTNDKMTWKLRHIYGGTVQDFRGFDKSVVAD
ncbi:MAG: hypothetical protein WD341_08805 [Tistlia sp.]|uniref:phage major capsid protein n=1 Tax=Tistlia sp. TaxID=3057121 RepID=UPI0034A23A1E